MTQQNELDFQIDRQLISKAWIAISIDKSDRIFIFERIILQDDAIVLKA